MVLALAAVCAPNTPIPVGLLGDAFAAANREPESTARRWLKRLPFITRWRRRLAYSPCGTRTPS